MNTPHIESQARKPLRLWPGVSIAVLVLLAWLILPRIPGAMIGAMLGGVAGGLLILLWWLLFSRAPWLERIGAIFLMVAVIFIAKRLVHPSIANAGMGMMINIFPIPVLSLALVAWAVITRHLSNGLRRATLVVALLLGGGLFTVVRTGGITGEGSMDLHWRWTPSPEDRLLAQTRNEPAPAAPGPATPVATALVKSVPQPARTEPAAKSSTSATRAPEKPATPAAVETRAIWPGFRGPERDSIVRGMQIETDWAKSPPVEMWRQPIGPGWSSFAVQGDLLYTQEQRGEEEDVSCYNLTNGKVVWRHRDTTRFWESNGGAGPRGTPTLSGGRVYTLGATGIVNVLVAASGAVVWTRNAATDTGAKLPIWGFSGSPLVVGDIVIVAASGSLVAYETATGNLRWLGPKGNGGSYSSPHLMTIGGVVQVLLESNSGVTSVALADGKELWKHEWPGTIMLQPAMTADGDILITASDMSGGVGMRRLAVAHGPDGWKVTERWTSRGLKPYFNDFVVHKGQAYGFDGSILACISLDDGQRKWKGGRYGYGQLVLLPDQDLLLVLSEEGELALVKATPDQFTEVARFRAIEGKTWNHPALAGNVLLVRNGEEMAAFRLSTAGH